MDRALAKCKGLTDLFYGQLNESPLSTYRRELRAISVCNTCLIITQCKSTAVKEKELYGVWGGLHNHELKRLGDTNVQP